MPLRSLIATALDELLALDVRLVRTLRRLLRPGGLTAEYLAGRRATYTSPLRLLLLAGFVFLLAIGLGQGFRPGNAGIVIDLPQETVTQLEGRRATLRERGTAWTRVRALWLESVLEAHRRPDQLNRLFVERASLMAVLLIPAFAFLLRLLYRRRLYLEHLVFALHLHAALFGGVGVALLLAMGGLLVGVPGGVPGVGFALLAVAIVVYTWMALRRVYEGGMVATTLKMGVLSGVYLVLFTAVLTAYAFVTIVAL